MKRGMIISRIIPVLDEATTKMGGRRADKLSQGGQLGGGGIRVC